ncbi:GGDEF domain-containing protein [Simplicispira suum]|uniref:diguanylate cyclase n=2 Tax=Simplicispira suum TaxID=2109915 RepID=A0A2S0MYR5_9BURK|nr:GGDEF domain-containing protein [Simplicispira suum]
MIPPPESAAPLALVRQRSLGWRLVWATLVFCALFIMVSVLALTWSAWNEGLTRMDAELAQIEQIYGDTLSKAIWELDREGLQTHVRSAKGIPSVGKIILTVTLANQPAEIFESARTGWTGPGWAPVRKLQLTYAPFPGAREEIGELVLFGDEKVLWQRLRSQLATIVVAQLLQSLMLAGLIMLMFNRMVTVHVRRIASHLEGVRPGNLGTHLSLERSSQSQDELTQLVSGVNQLQGSLASHLERQQRYEQELAQHRDRLAQLVQERTAELQAANERLQSLARTDPLTGLPNRRHFDEAKATEMRRARRHGHSLSLLICDIDSFKDYNDHYGHAMGDTCLRAVAQALRNQLGRAGDMVARIGGEEFGVLLPATSGPAALMLAERLREAVAACAIEHLHSTCAQVVTISIGLAVRESGATEEFGALFQRADQALYRAKAAGRNQVVGPENRDWPAKKGEAA